VLKIRAKKIGAKTIQSNDSALDGSFSSFGTNTAFFETLSRDFFLESGSLNYSTSAFNPIILNNEATANLNFRLLADYKNVQAFY
jgi:hypothetical protein